MTKVGQIVENVTRVGQKSLYPPQSPTPQTIPAYYMNHWGMYITDIVVKIALFLFTF